MRTFEDFFKDDSSEMAEGEMFSNLTHNDMIGRAVQLSNEIADYDLYRRTLRQEFGLNDVDLERLCNEAMNVVAMNIENNAKAGTVNNPSNNPGERHIDVKKSEQLPKGKFYAGPNVKVGFVPIPDAPKPKPTFSKFWAKLTQPFTSYRDSKNAHESTQTQFKQMWKGEVQKSHPDPKDDPENRKPEDETSKPDETKKDAKQEIINCIKVITREAIKNGKSLNDNLYDYVFSKIPNNVFDILSESDVENVIDETKRGMGKSQIAKTLSNEEKKVLAEQILKHFENSQDPKWLAKCQSWLKSQGAGPDEVNEILDVVSGEMMLGKSLENEVDEMLQQF